MNSSCSQWPWSTPAPDSCYSATKIDGGSDSTLHLDATALPPKLKSRHLMAIPVGDEGLLGVIDKETRQGFQAFTEADAHLLALTGQQAGTALANARLYRSIATCKSLVSM